MNINSNIQHKAYTMRVTCARGERERDSFVRSLFRSFDRDREGKLDLKVSCNAGEPVIIGAQELVQQHLRNTQKT